MRNRFCELVVRQDLRDSSFLLLKTMPRYEYKDNKKTNEIVGYKFEVLPWSDKSVGPQAVTVLDTKLPSGVSVGIPNGDLFLKFEGWQCTEYYSDYTHRREIAVKADTAQVVGENKGHALPTL